MRFRATARNLIQQKESRSALPKAKENLINRIWYEMQRLTMATMKAAQCEKD